MDNYLNFNTYKQVAFGYRNASKGFFLETRARCSRQQWGALAVAKYSLIFWKDYDFTKFSTFGVKGNNPRGAIVIGADTAGTIIGGGLGAAGGSFLGPAGTIGGWFGGAAAGAWYGSASAATAIGIYDYIFN